MNGPRIITVRPDGTVEFVADVALAAAYTHAGGRVDRQRASRIEPVWWPARVVVGVVRRYVADDSRAAALTRRWPGRWRVAIIGGPTFGRYWDRAAAVAAEVAWLQHNRL